MEKGNVIAVTAEMLLFGSASAHTQRMYIDDGDSQKLAVKLQAPPAPGYTEGEGIGGSVGPFMAHDLN